MKISVRNSDGNIISRIEKRQRMRLRGRDIVEELFLGIFNMEGLKGLIK